ncbi:unnamed protein product [Ceutorhynchus assimilis]|uniref:O-acyltransferase WSD1 C-terminal domain-containing protein n=1 Tax=Ceutorhynchus assimilis TaxID=467358 RepID=A0A9N9MH08_9CUCU|nr:unnamed protein product [Ceutorhynchus assimilis]
MSCTITTVFIVKTEKEKNIFNDVRLRLKEKIFDEPNWYPKLSHSIHDFGGYAYLLNNNREVDDAVKLMAVPSNVQFDEEYLKTITAEINSSELSINNSLLWYVYVSDKPLQNQGNDNFYRYSIIFRFHHAVGDGTSLVALLIRLLGTESSQNYNEKLFKKLFAGKNSEPGKNRTYKYYLLNMFKFIQFWFTVIFISIGRFQNKNLLEPADKNALHSSKLSGKKTVAWGTEDYPECLNMVKNVKNRLPNATFSIVVATAISNSMTSFFKRNSLPVPDFTTGLMIILLKFPDTVPSKQVRLENKATTLLLDLPSTHKSESLLSALKNVTMQMESQLSYADALVVRFAAAELFGYLPINLGNEIVGFNKQTFILTNVPGGSVIKIFDGCVVEKVIPIAPNLRHAAVSFALLTYDDRFQIGLLVDKALVNSQDEAKKIVDDILESIKVLDKESQLLLD